MEYVVAEDDTGLPHGYKPIKQGLAERGLTVV